MLSLSLTLAFTLGATSARADVDDQTRASARDLAVQGRAAYAAGDYETARDLFHRAYALVSAPTVSLYEARALTRLGRLVEAAEAYMRTVQTPIDSRAPEQFQRALADAEVERTALKPRIPTLFLAVSGTAGTDPGVVITVDGVETSRELLGVDRPMNPGDHRVVIRRAGHPDVSAAFSLAEGEHRRVELAAPDSPPGPGPGGDSAAPPPGTVHEEGRNRSTARTTGYVLLGVGAVGIAAGVATGIWATARHADAEKECPDNRCAPASAGSDAVDSFRTLRTVSTVGYVVGALGALAGGTLLFVVPSKEAHPSARSVRLWVGAGRAGLSGAF